MKFDTKISSKMDFGTICILHNMREHKIDLSVYSTILFLDNFYGKFITKKIN